MKHDNHGNIILILLLYVDDVLYESTGEQLTLFEQDIKERFKIKNRDQAEEFIGVQQET